ncbi:MAG: hypothetical protein ACK4HV_04645, partial [Parachlamydiaceae bacterium]
MELPPSGLYPSLQSGIPQTIAPPPLNAFIPLTNVSLSDEPERSKLRRVTVEEGAPYARIPTPFEREDRKAYRRYQAFTAQYPNLSDQLIALRSIENEHEIRKQLVFDLTESGKIDEAFHFYLEMARCEEKERFLKDYYKDITAPDKREKLRAIIANVEAFQPDHFENFLLLIAHALVLSDQFEPVIEIYNRLKTLKVDLLYFIFRSKIRKGLEENPISCVQLIKNRFPEPMLSELFFVAGTALIKFKKSNLISFFIDDMRFRKTDLQ